MLNSTLIKAYDGNDEIFFSDSFNIYEDELIISNLAGFKMRFRFDRTEPREDQKDIEVAPGDNKEVTVTFSKKFRNNLGSVTTEKLNIFTTAEKRQILFSVFGQQVGDGRCLHITVNFYLR